MRSFYAQFWPLHSSAKLRRAIIVSIVLHIAIVSALTIRLPREFQLTQAGMYSVELINPSAPPAEAPPLGKPMVAPPVDPQPAPPPPPPKKEEPKPKPEPKKEEPKPVKPVKEEKPKPEKPKEEKPKKETPKEERKKEKEEEKKKPEEKPVKIARNDNPLNDVSDNPLDDLNAATRPTRKQTQPVPGVATGKPGLTMAGGVPSVLGMWGGLVQRKVEKEWVVPEGIQLGPVDDGALISFWVNRDGQLVGEPSVEKHAVDSAVAVSAIRAIKSAVPYPALPDSFGDAKVQVYYTFIPIK